MSIVVRRAFVFLLSVALLAPTTSALDPASKAFRSAAKSAEKDVRAT